MRSSVTAALGCLSATLPKNTRSAAPASCASSEMRSKPTWSQQHEEVRIELSLPHHEGIDRPSSQKLEAMLYLLPASSGVRIGEALTVRIGPSETYSCFADGDSRQGVRGSRATKDFSA